jgi:hypothetical protein
MELNIPKIWNRKTVTIVGGGPSLNGFDFGRLQGIVIGTNHSPKYHRADMIIAIDARFHEREKDFLDSLDCLKCTYVQTTRQDFAMAVLNPDYDNYLTDLDWHVLKANMSGYFAIAVALHLGAKKVILLGYDGGYTVGEQTPNFHPYHYEGPGMNFYTPMNQYYDFWKNENIVNVGMDSKIRAFKKVPLESDFYE